MRISDVTVGNYRSIDRRTRFNLADLTTLVGPNNEGKSNLLRSLALGLRVIEEWGSLPDEATRTGVLIGRDAIRVYESNRLRRRTGRDRDVSYEWFTDFPLHKQVAQSPKPTVIRIRFRLSDEEMADFRKVTGLSNNGDLPIELHLGRRRTSLQVVKQGRGAAGYSKKAPAIARFVSERIDCVMVPAMRTMDQAISLLNELASIRLAELARTDQYREALRQVNELRASVVEGVQADLKSTISSYLPGVESVELEQRDVRASHTISRVTIDDGSATSLEQKGDGIKSLFSLALIQHLARERISDVESNLVLLVDEPEAHLHSRAVHDLLALFTKISREQQVVLATHNPIFVNRDEVSANVLVRGNTASAARSVRDIRDVLGVELHDNLNSAEVVVVTEGWTDVSILPVALRFLDGPGSKDIAAGRIVFKSATGTGKIARLIQQERSTACKIIVVLDGDKAGDLEAQRLHDTGVIDKKNIFVLRDSGRSQSEIEDMILPQVYLDAMAKKFGRKFKENQFRNPRKKWSENFRAAALQLGVSGDEAENVTAAKVAVSDAVKCASEQPFKTSSLPVLMALGEAIWGERAGD
ncbi:ATP-dependent endonuclease [Brachybacterium sp. GCM10030268]